MRRHALIHRLVHVGVEALSMRELRGFSDFCGVLRGLGIAARVCIGSGRSQGQPGNGRESSCGVISTAVRSFTPQGWLEILGRRVCGDTRRGNS